MRKSLFLLLFGLHLAANPSGLNVVHGDVVISSGLQEVNIRQLTDKAILHWREFSIQKGEAVRFLQASKDSVVLNRVVGDLPSSIYGLLQANGKVYLINSQGVLVGPEGKVQTNGFVAASLDIANDEFLAQSVFHFHGASERKVTNLGVIEALEGSVFLLAQEVENQGQISAHNVGLAGASEVLLVPEGKQRIFIQPQAVGRLENRGTIGAVEAELKAAGGSVYALALNHSGVIEVKGLGSEVIVQAEKGGISLEGKISSDGGAIHAFGEKIHLADNCEIDASSKGRGGEILIGGDERGNRGVALTTYVAPSVQIHSDAIEEGNGGKVIVWGKEACYVYGSITARGGQKGGDGGFVEVSGLKAYDYKGTVNTLAPYGRTGTFLIDPSDITISTAVSSPAFPTSPGVYNPPGATGTLNNTDLETGLGTSNVLVTTTGGTGGTGNITWSSSASISWSAATTLTLTADRAISLGSNITNTGTGTFTAMNFTANSGGATAGTFVGIDVLAGVTISSTEGAIVMNGTGGGGGVANGNIGVRLNTGSVIQSTGTGAGAATISITGAGGAAASANNYGVQVNGAATQITSIAGGISITGTSAATAGTGNNTNHGIYVSVGGSILSTGASSGATITLNGTGAAAQTTNIGVYITDTNSLVSSVSGAIDITGVGGAGAAASNAGVQIDSAGKVTSTGTGVNAASITITGTGGAGTNNNVGIFLTGANSSITSADGSITLVGTGGGAGTTNRGVELVSNAFIEYGGSSAGTISITGTGSGTSGTGVRFSGSLGVTASTSSPKDIVFLGTDSSDTAILFADTLGGANTTGDITLEGDTINIGSSTITTTGDILIQPKTPATSIGLAGASGTLSISTAQLNTIQAGSSSLTIGRADGSGTTTINSYAFNTNTTLQNSDLVVNGALTNAVGQSFTLIADTMDIGAAVTAPTTLTVQPLTASTTIGLGTGATGTLNLTSTELGNLSGTLITFGQTLQSGAVDMQANTYTTPITVNGNTIGVNGAVDAGTNSVTFNIGLTSTGTLNLSSTVTTSGTFQVNGWANNDAFNIITTSAQTAILSGGGGTNTITGPNTTNAWTITADNSGTLNTTITFSSIASLIGGTGTDTFTFNGAFQLNGVTGINGGTGSNTITGPNVSNAWAITADNGGTLTPTGATGATVFTNVGSLVGGSGSDTFTFNGTFQLNGTTGIDAGTGSNTINAPNVTNAWAISADNGGTLTPTGASGATTFTNVGSLVGGTGIDTFTFNGAFQLNGTTGINGGTGVNTITGPNVTNSWSITADNGGSLTPTGATGATAFTNVGSLVGGTGTDTFTFTGAFQLNGTTGINGGTGSNTITAPNVTNGWSITADNEGTLTPTGALGATAFTNVGSLVGGSGIDTFTFTGAFQLNGSTGIDGGTGSNTINAPNVTNGWSITADNGGTLTPTGALGATTFANIGSLVGGSGIDTFTFNGAFQLNGSTGIDGGTGSNTITGPNVTNAWAITADNGGTLTPTGALGPTTFTNIGSLVGGTGIDTFTFNGAFQLNGTTGIDGSTGSNTITGPDATNSWSITADNGGTLTPTGALGATTFTNIGSLVGGSGIDTFTFTGAFQLNGATGIDGATGASTITGPNVTNAWAVTANNGGTLTPTGALGATTFANVGSLVGGTGIDGFTFTGAFQLNGTTGIDGGVGTNTITGPNVTNAWTITADNGGTLTPTGAPGATTFANVGNLVGGTGVDTFTFTGAFQISGDIDGGTGANTITGPNVSTAWAIIADNQGSLTPTGATGATTFTSIGSLIGGTGTDTFSFGGAFQLDGATGIDGGTGSSTITGPNVTNAWAITANNGGTLTPTGATGPTTFANVRSIAGGTGIDTFTFAGAFQLNGTTGIDGGTGANTITGPDVNTVWTITADNGGTLTPTGAPGTTTFANLESLIGGTGADTFTFSGAFQISSGINGGTGSNTIVGSTVTDTWTLTGADAGSINPTGALGATAFTSIGNLTGGPTQGNVFTFNVGSSLSGALNGTTSSGNSLIYAAGFGTTNITLSSSAANGTAAGIAGGFSNIQSFTGSTSLVNTFTSPGGSNTWVITASNAGTLNTSVSFSNFPNLTGGSGNDLFNFSAGFTVTGLVDGGVGSNTLVGPNSTNTWNITDTDQGNVTGITFINIGNLTGNTLIDVFSFADQKGVTGVIDGSSGANILDYSLFTIPAEITQITSDSGTASNLGVGYVDVTNFVGNFIFVTPPPPLPITFSSTQIQSTVAQAQIAMIGTQAFVLIGNTLSSISYGQYGAPLNGVFYLLKILTAIEITDGGVNTDDEEENE